MFVTTEGQQGHRRIDRVLAENFLAGIGSASIDELRSMRADAEQEEADQSYLRRLLQGRIDILRAEAERRRADGAGQSLVEALPQILADERGAPHGLGQHRTVEPSRVDEHRRRVEALIANLDISDVGGSSDEEIARAIATLEAEEHEISETRRQVQTVADACATEITRRYRDGEADVSDLPPSEPAGG
jgi:anti-sigma-K factor RsiG